MSSPSAETPRHAHDLNSAMLASALTTWFSAARRDLPWRRGRTAYHVWLSEVMLQQTRVAVVEDYFTRFVGRFPDVAALAAATEDDVLSMWSGLGYYSRGRNLHRAARAVVTLHGGRFPDTVEGLSALPGVGPYTASAVASLAFGVRTGVVDGNVARVLSRLYDDATPVDSNAGKALLTARAQALVDASEAPGPVNEGLMELGALVCTPKSPRCGSCPWAEACLARKAGTALARPVKAPKRARKHVRIAVVVVVDGEQVWLEKRASRGLFGGLYEPPSAQIDDVETSAHVTWQALCEARGLPQPSRWPAPVVVERTLTHRELALEVALLRVSRTTSDGPHWHTRLGLTEIGLSSAVRAVLESVWPEDPAQPSLFAP